MERIPTLADLYPQRNATLAILMASGLAIVALLAALYHFTLPLGRYCSDGRIEAFDLDGEGSLAVFFSSFTLCLAAAAALGIYTIGKRRLGDYRAQYRVWLAAAAVWLLMSIDEAGSLHEGFKEMMTILTGQRLLGDGSLWWVAAYMCVLLPLGGALWPRMARPAQYALIACAVAWGLAVLTQLQWILPESGAQGVMLEESLEMIGNLCILLSMALQARQVIQEVSPSDAAARVEPPAKEAEPTPEPASAGKSRSTTKTRTASAKPEPSVGDEIDEDDIEDEADEASEADDEDDDPEEAPSPPARPAAPVAKSSPEPKTVPPAPHRMAQDDEDEDDEDDDGRPARKESSAGRKQKKRRR
jgi:hypothetical protein